MKEDVLKTIDFFGLVVKDDLWDDLGCIMVVCPWLYPETQQLNIYKSDIENGDNMFLREELINFLLRLGEHNLKVKINNLILI